VIHDPLYRWSLSPLKARERERERERMGERDKEKNEKNERNAEIENSQLINNPDDFCRDAAERTLLRVKNKLLGFEDPTSGVLGVEGQVELVMAESRSVDNLSKLFPGWNPWL
jgi:serine-protein kinase ATM